MIQGAFQRTFYKVFCPESYESLVVTDHCSDKNIFTGVLMCISSSLVHNWINKSFINLIEVEDG